MAIPAGYGGGPKRYWTQGAAATTMSPMTNPNPLIESIDAVLVDLPTIRAHKLAMTTMRQHTLVIVRATCSDGRVGIGEATTIGGLAYGEQSPEGIHSAIET